MNYLHLFHKIPAVRLIGFVALLTGCSGENNPTSNIYDKNGYFNQTRTYISAQPGVGRCAIPDGCFAQMTFTKDGTGTVIFTDIANRVNYSVQKNVLTTSLVGQGDIPKTLQFDVVDGARSLVRQDTGMIFNLKPPSIAVYRATGAIACEPDTGISINQSEALLTAKQIKVDSSYCGYLANIVRPAVCGIPTDKVYVHLIAQDQLAGAEKLGFSVANKDATSEVTPTPCSN